MTLLQFVAFSVAVLVAGFVQGSTGVGFALIVAPVISLMKPELLPVCLLILMLPLNAYVVWRERAALDKVGAAWISSGRIVGTAGGLWVLVALSASQLGIFVGLATIAAALATMIAPSLSWANLAGLPRSATMSAAITGPKSIAPFWPAAA